MTDRTSFGTWLRRERERRGLTLDAIASRTKIAGSLLAGLEEGNLSRWPTGIFRRAFVRAYAEAIGLDPDDVLTEFASVHPEVGEPVVTVPRRVTAGAVRADALRLTLDETSRRPWRDPRRITGAALDGGAMALVFAWLWATPLGWVGIALAWLLVTLYVMVGVLVLDGTPGQWLVGRVSARSGTQDEEVDEQSFASLEVDPTVVPFKRARRLRRPPRPSAGAERTSRVSGEGRARTH